MPGFSEGMANVSRDEQRHIGFGVKVLSECFAESEECKEAVAELLRELLPYSLAVFTPPNWDLEYTRCYGFELEDIYAFGLRSVRTKWRATGYPLEEMPGVLPIDPELDARGGRAAPDQPAEGRRDGRAQRPARLLARDPAAASSTSSRGSRAPTRVNGNPMTIQWRFDDAEPWHLRIDNGSTAAEPGLAPDARPDPGDELARLDRGLGPGRRSARALLRRRRSARAARCASSPPRKVFPARPSRLS